MASRVLASLNRLSLKRKLVLLSGTAVLVLLVVLLIGVLGIRSGMAGVSEIGRNRLPSVLALQSIEEAQIALKATTYEAALWEKDTEAQQLFAAIASEKKQIWRRIDVAWQTYQSIAKNQEEAQVWASFVKEWDAWKRIDDEITALIVSLSGNTDEAQQAVLFQQYYDLGSRQRKHHIETEKLLERVIALNAEHVAAETLQAERATALAQYLMIGVGGGAVALLLSLALVLSASILRQMGGEPADAVRIARRVADGDLSLPVPVRAGDDHSLLASLAHMQQQLKELLDRLRGSEAALNKAQSIANMGSWTLDIPSDHIEWSAETYRIFSIPQGTAITGELFFEHVHEDDCEAVQQAWQGALGGIPYDIEYRIVVDGSIKWVRGLADLTFDAAGKPLYCTGALQDVTATHLSEESLRASKSRFESLFANMSEGVALHQLVYDASGKPVNYRIIEVNPQYENILGLKREKVLGRLATEVYEVADAPYLETYCQVALSGHASRLETCFLPMDKTFDISIVPWDDQGFATIFTDITERKHAEKSLRRAAYYDALTQLPNRVLLADRLEQAKAQARRAEQSLAVCFLDLDGFKPINDTFGHETGDQLLIDVAVRLKAALRGGDTVARLGGDEFVILLGELESQEECHQALARLLSVVSAPYDIHGTPTHISASIGVTLYPHDDADADALIRHADQAMYLAKLAGRNRYHHFDPERDRQVRAHRESLARLGEAIPAGEFRLFYQPKVNMRNNTVIGAEALIRWQHPERGLLPPAEFLPVVEGSELDIPLGEWVLAEALRQLDIWHRMGYPISVSINISTRQLEHPEFTHKLKAALAQYPELVHGALELEILETSAMNDITRISAIIESYKEMGVHFALDDFGTGYSSLSYLKRLPAQTLKIDQSFVRDMLDDPEDQAIVKGVIALSKAFRRNIIAEGVETAQHGRWLMHLGCDLAQGYGIARPMPADLLPEWIDGYRVAPGWLEDDDGRHSIAA